MRLWHIDLIPVLPRLQLLGQHRECCALRGKGWGKRHSIVNYVFHYDYNYLFFYHKMVMSEMERRGYHPNPIWKDFQYRGRKLYRLDLPPKPDFFSTYPEHNADYLKRCLRLLQEKMSRKPNIYNEEEFKKIKGVHYGDDK